jgi:hypothetical protein
VGHCSGFLSASAWHVGPDKAPVGQKCPTRLRLPAGKVPASTWAGSCQEQSSVQTARPRLESRTGCSGRVAPIDPSCDRRDGERQISDLAVRLPVLGTGEHPRGHGTGVCEPTRLIIDLVMRHVVVLRSRQEQYILPHQRRHRVTIIVNALAIQATKFRSTRFRAAVLHSACLSSAMSLGCVKARWR